MKITRTSILATVMCFTLAQQPARAIVVAFDFFQGGYSDGAVVTGMFEGEDLDMDGSLVYHSDGKREISFFMLEFSGNSIPEFTLTTSDLLTFIHVLGTGDLGDDESATDGFEFIDVDGDGADYVAGLVLDPLQGVVLAAFDDIVGFSTTSELIVVHPKGVSIPEANSTVLLLSLGIFGLSVTRRFLSLCVD